MVYFLNNNYYNFIFQYKVSLKYLVTKWSKESEFNYGVLGMNAYLPG